MYSLSIIIAIVLVFMVITHYYVGQGPNINDASVHHSNVMDGRTDGRTGTGGGEWLSTHILSLLPQFTSSHLSTSSNHLSVGASSVPSIPDYVYSQLSNPLITSPEAKKIQQDICALSHRGKRGVFIKFLIGKSCVELV